MQALTLRRYQTKGGWYSCMPQSQHKLRAHCSHDGGKEQALAAECHEISSGAATFQDEQVRNVCKFLSQGQANQQQQAGCRDSSP